MKSAGYNALSEGRRSTEVQAATHSVTNSNSGPPLAAVGHGAEIKLLESRYLGLCFLSLSPLLTFCVARLPEAFGEGVVVDLELGDLLVLVGGDGDELRLLEDIRPEGGVRQLGDVARPHQVKPRLVLVH